MNSTVLCASRRKVAVFSATSLATLTLLLSACSASESADSAGESQSTATSSASTSKSQSSSVASDSNSSSTATNDESSKAENSESPTAEASASSGKETEAAAEELYAGAENLKNAESVSLDQEQVSQTQELYTQYEDAIETVKTVEVATASEEESEAEGDSDESEPTESKSLTLDTSTTEKIEAISTGSAADEFLASALEFGTNGWSQKGKSKIVGEPKVADTEYQGQAAKILEVCIDSSEVTVTDGAGNVLTSDAAPKRSLNIFTLIKENGTWKIAAHDFPNNPDC